MEARESKKIVSSDTKQTGSKQMEMINSKLYKLFECAAHIVTLPHMLGRKVPKIAQRYNEKEERPTTTFKFEWAKNFLLRD